MLVSAVIMGSVMRTFSHLLPELVISPVFAVSATVFNSDIISRGVFWSQWDQGHIVEGSGSFTRYLCWDEDVSVDKGINVVLLLRSKLLVQ